MPKGVYIRIEGKIYGMSGKHHSKESILKNSISHIGKIAWNKNKSPSEETRQKQSMSHIGKVRSEESRLKQSQTNKGRVSGMKGKNQTEEAKQKISKKLKGLNTWSRNKVISKEIRLKISIGCKGKNVGEKNGNWRNGASFEPYPLGWNNTYKEQIRYRDKYTCQLCGCSELENKRKLCVHHINYIKENINSDNLIALCNSCHSKTNNNREYWVRYFRENKKCQKLY